MNGGRRARSTTGTRRGAPRRGLAIARSARGSQGRARPACRSDQAHRVEIESVVVREVAKTPAEAAAELDYALSFVSYARDRIDAHDFEVEVDQHRRVRKVGYGTTLLIAPFNDPVAGLLRKIAPPMAAGSTALVKPSAAATATALAVGAAIDAAGLGDLVRILALSGQAAEGLIDDARIGLVSFTGSTATGLAVAARAARASKPAITELGGNNPFVICADADLDRAIEHLVTRKLRARRAGLQRREPGLRPS